MKIFYLVVKSVIIGLFLFTVTFAQQNDKVLKHNKWRNEPLKIFNKQRIYAKTPQTPCLCGEKLLGKSSIK